MIKRELYLNQIERLIDKEPIKIITGVRRNCKTYLNIFMFSHLYSFGPATVWMLLHFGEGTDWIRRNNSLVFAIQNKKKRMVLDYLILNHS